MRSCLTLEGEWAFPNLFFTFRRGTGPSVEGHIHSIVIAMRVFSYDTIDRAGVRGLSSTVRICVCNLDSE